MLSHLFIFVAAFCFMEFAAWFLHRFVMHGFLWSLHRYHHTPVKGRWWQRNDAFALFFAVPSFLFILFGSYWWDTHWATLGYGIMTYGAFYFFIHEVIIHRRLKFLEFDHWYLNALVRAHRDHHKIRFKEGCENFGMLIVSLRYFHQEKAKL